MNRRSRTGLSIVVFLAVTIGITGLWAALRNDPTTPEETAPESREWSRLAPAALEPGSTYASVWTGNEMIVWGASFRSGGLENVVIAEGAAFHRASNTWRELPMPPLVDRWNVSVVWTGEEMIVWGGFGDLQRNFADGAAYDPGRNVWRRVAESPLRPRHQHVAVWTGGRMLIWGGWQHEGPVFADGAMYDPASDTWSLVPGAPLDASDSLALRAVWTGDEVLVTGVEQGAAYNPKTGQWRELPSWPLPREQVNHESVWTGRELLVWSGCCRNGREAVGASYDPETNQWRRLPNFRIGASRRLVLWTGEAMLVLGTDTSARGGNARKFFAAAFDPVENSWRPFPLSATGFLSGSTAIWTGSTALIWGGNPLRGPAGATRWPGNVVEFDPAASRR